MYRHRAHSFPLLRLGDRFDFHLALASASALILVLYLDVFIAFSVEDGVEEGLKFVWEDHSVFRYWIEGMWAVRQYCQLRVFIALYSRFSRYSRAPALAVISILGHREK